MERMGAGYAGMVLVVIFGGGFGYYEQVEMECVRWVGGFLGFRSPKKWG